MSTNFLLIIILLIFVITEDLNLSMSNMITGINETKSLTKHVSCKYKYRFDGRKCNSDQ